MVQLDDPLSLDDSGDDELPGTNEELPDGDSSPLDEMGSLPDGSGSPLGGDESLPRSLVDGVTSELTASLDRPLLVDSLLSEGVADSLEIRLSDEDPGGESLLLGELDGPTSLDGLLPDEFGPDEGIVLDDATLFDPLGDEIPLSDEPVDSVSLDDALLSEDDGSADVLGNSELTRETPLLDGSPIPLDEGTSPLLEGVSDSEDELVVPFDEEIGPELLTGSADDDGALGVESLLLDGVSADEELVSWLVDVEVSLENPDDELSELLGAPELGLPLEDESTSDEPDELLVEDDD